MGVGRKYCSFDFDDSLTYEQRMGKSCFGVEWIGADGEDKVILITGMQYRAGNGVSFGEHCLDLHHSTGPSVHLGDSRQPGNPLV